MKKATCNARDKAVPAQTDEKRILYGKRAGIIGILSNLVLFSIKLAAGISSASLSIVADALNNLSDAGSSALTLVGFRLSGRPADEKHPYGHARMEYIAGLILSISVIFIGLQLTGESFEKILHPSVSFFRYLTAIILLISIAVKCVQGAIYRAIAKKIDSPVLRAACTDSFSDAAVTSAVLIGSLCERYFSISLDGCLGLLVSVCIFVTGIKLVKETSDPLLGSAPSPELLREIKEKLRANKEIWGFHDLIVHSYGEGRNFATVHIEVSAHMPLLKLHEIMDDSEKMFAREMGLQMVIHPDPVDPEDEETERLKIVVANALSVCCPDAAFHDFRAVNEKDAVRLFFDIAVKESSNGGKKESDQALCRKIAEEIRKTVPSAHAVITVDRNYVSSVNED